jgi:hypothetical protein
MRPIQQPRLVFLSHGKWRTCGQSWRMFGNPRIGGCDNKSLHVNALPRMALASLIYLGFQNLVHHLPSYHGHIPLLKVTLGGLQM